MPKNGHTGTLNTIATRVLPICFGRTTKIAQYLLNANKEYIVTIKLGIITDTGDVEGNVIPEKNNISTLTKTLIEDVI